VSTVTSANSDQAAGPKLGNRPEKFFAKKRSWT